MSVVNYSRIIGGQQGWCRSPPWSILTEYRKRSPNGISEEQKLAVAEKLFWVALWCIGNIWKFIEVELSQEVPWGAHEPEGGAPGLVASLWLPRSSPEASMVPSGPKKSLKSFVSFGLRLFLKIHKQVKKTTTVTGHYINRLVPKNDIKMTIKWL